MRRLLDAARVNVAVAVAIAITLLGEGAWRAFVADLRGLP